MEITKNGLKKPAQDDFYNVDDFNINTDIVENHLANKDIHVVASEIADIEEADELTQIVGSDDNSKMWGKIKKLITDFLEHIKTSASSSVLGHVKLSDTYATKVANGAAKDGVGASQNALYEAYNKLNNNLANIFTDDNSCEIFFGTYAQNNVNYYATSIFCPQNAEIKFTEAAIEGTYVNLKDSMKYIKNGCHARIYSTNPNMAGKLVMIRWNYIYI